MVHEQAGGPAGQRSRWIRTVLASYERPLLLYAARLLGDAERARDVVQDVFLRLCDRGPGPIENDPRLAAWLFTICRNRATDVRRKEGHMRPLSEVEVPEQRAPQPEPAVAAEVRDAVHSVMQLLTQLPDKQQEALRLKFQQGLSYREIAAVMDQSVSNVGFLLHAGLKALRLRMARSGHGGF